MPAPFSASWLAGQVTSIGPGEILYAQGDPSETVLYVQSGQVTLSLTSRGGKEAIVGMLHGGDFCGEGALAGQRVRPTTATTGAASRIRVIPKDQMIRLLHQDHAFAEYFIGYMLTRNRRLEDNLVDQMFHSSEQRLARTLLLLSAYEETSNGPRPLLHPITQEVLAEMVGTTRSRVNLFMNRFRKDGLINYDAHGLTVHDTLREVVRRENPAADR